jgi:hypothetical protein
MVDKLVSSFSGATDDLVKPGPINIVLDYIKNNWDNNFDWDGINTVKFYQWWSAQGAMSIEATETYSTTSDAALGRGMIQTDAVVTLDIFARQIQFRFPLIVSTFIRFVRNLIETNPRALVSQGIHGWRITKASEAPESDPKSSIYHYKMDITLVYFHSRITL